VPLVAEDDLSTPHDHEVHFADLQRPGVVDKQFDDMAESLASDSDREEESADRATRMRTRHRTRFNTGSGSDSDRSEFSAGSAFSSEGSASPVGPPRDYGRYSRSYREWTSDDERDLQRKRNSKKKASSNWDKLTSRLPNLRQRWADYTAPAPPPVEEIPVPPKPRSWGRYALPLAWFAEGFSNFGKDETILPPNGRSKDAQDHVPTGTGSWYTWPYRATRSYLTAVDYPTEIRVSGAILGFGPTIFYRWCRQVWGNRPRPSNKKDWTFGKVWRWLVGGTVGTFIAVGVTLFVTPLCALVAFPCHVVGNFIYHSWCHVRGYSKYDY
jgi:hypothetical protein